MSASSFDYAVIRAVPRVERQEFVNVGVILFCRTRRYLAAKITPDLSRLTQLAGTRHLENFEERLALIPEVCQGSSLAGPMAQWELADRFHWLTSPCSSGIQASPIHSGICEKPAEALERLYALLVAPLHPK